jgi:hypothetical protein
MASSARHTVSAVGAIALAACAAQPSVPGGDLVQGRPCAEAALARLAEWGAAEERLEAPPSPGAARSVRIATHEIGRWILIDLPITGAATLTRVTPDGAERLTWSPACRASVEHAPGIAGASRDRARFSDADLSAALALTGGPGEPRGVIVYLWAPHMPLSVDGYAEIAAAGASLELPVVPVLSPGSDPDFAVREAGRVGIPSDALREATSVELAFRDAYVHAPAIVAFVGGRASPVLPGYRDRDAYVTFLEDFLTAR